MKYCKVILSVLAFSLIFSCSESGSNSSNSSAQLDLKKAPIANADSVYSFVKQQVDFGPRVPNTEEHKKAADWYVRKFESYGANVTVQEFKDRVYDGTEVQLKNIIASFNPSVKKRILLAAHWDTRPFADKDEVDQSQPIDGANDGASGVAVLLEVARVISQDSPSVGVDIILFDGEDWGEPITSSGNIDPREYDKESWYCLGSQYWSKNKHRANYSAFYGILLDMVGAEDATFLYDGVSQQNAQRVLTRTWDIAHSLGHQDLFIKEQGLSLGFVDDHVFVNKNARIPMIDIIDYRKGENDFGPYHHRQKDNMEIISKETLIAVTEVVLTVLFNE